MASSFKISSDVVLSVPIPIKYDAACPESMKCVWDSKVTDEERARNKKLVADVSEHGVEWLKCSSPPIPEFHDSSTPSPTKQQAAAAAAAPAKAPAMLRSQSEPN